jgi:hypothetical protein
MATGCWKLSEANNPEIGPKETMSIFHTLPPVQK